MKKILYAWIEQIISFDSSEEQELFISKTKGLEIVDCDVIGGKYILHVKRPYNNNKMG